MTYSQAITAAGSEYRLAQALKNEELYRVARGVYSRTKYIDPYLVAHTLYPNGIITMDSAFFFHGLTNIAPQQVHLVTQRNTTRIKDHSIKQYFASKNVFEPGCEMIDYQGECIRIYNQERMLVELMRNSVSMPLDFYKEIVNSYRRRIDSLDIRKVEDYISLFKRNDYLFNILQREVF